MSFPKPQLLADFVDYYLSAKSLEWAKVGGRIKRGLKWFTTVVVGTTYQSPLVKTEICTKMKTAILTPVGDGKAEIDKWAQICIDLGKAATATLLDDGKSSSLAKYLHAIRTYILAKLLDELHTRDQLRIVIYSIKMNLAENGEESKIPLKENAKKLLDLAYLGDFEAIKELNAQHLLDMYPDDGNKQLVYFLDNYFSLDFFRDEIEPNSIANSFSEFEMILSQPLPPSEKPVNLSLLSSSEISLSTSVAVRSAKVTSPINVPVKESIDTSVNSLPSILSQEIPPREETPTLVEAGSPLLTPTPIEKATVSADSNIESDLGVLASSGLSSSPGSPESPVSPIKVEALRVSAVQSPAPLERPITPIADRAPTSIIKFINPQLDRPKAQPEINKPPKSVAFTLPFFPKEPRRPKRLDDALYYAPPNITFPNSPEPIYFEARSEPKENKAALKESHYNLRPRRG